MLLFLTETPAWSGEDFNTQKGRYAGNALAVCADQCCVTYYYTGWPGLTHDNHSWRNCNLNMKEAVLSMTLNVSLETLHSINHRELSAHTKCLQDMIASLQNMSISTLSWQRHLSNKNMA
jgi:hypothetical protein